MGEAIYQLVGGINGEPVCVLRLADNAYIPFDEGNTDYQAYLRWRAEGNEPLPFDAPPTS